MRPPPVIKYLVIGILVIIAWMIVRQLTGFDEIQWRGEKFKLKKKYASYEDYKSGSGQLADTEVENVKKAMLSISVPESVRSEDELRKALRQMRFPGFGSSYNGNVKDEKGNRYILNEYEIPQTHEQRTLLYRVNSDGSCQRVVDGVSVDHENDHAMGQSEARVEGGVLRHYLDGKQYREIALDVKQ